MMYASFRIPDPPWDDLTVYDVADAILCAPDSHRDTIRQRLAALRANGADDFADLAETFFDLSDEKAARDDAFVRALERWAET